ncbi:hypothetical protein [Candidatus Tisiphia endosymbiont of Nemotelus uliginosus]|uniref:hypothetical protein n=1 Tax=Candidatus Tisiphia endosymbiont of Nemotelus uliginosus TaxID=3077926 RepID=UPI0035C8CCB1
MTCNNVTEPLYNKLIISLKSGLVTTLTCENLEDDDNRVYSLKSSWLNNHIEYQDHCSPEWTSWITDTISYVVNNYIYPNYYSSSSYTANITSLIEDNILSPLYRNCLNKNLDQDVLIGDSTDRRSIQDQSPYGYSGLEISIMAGSIIGSVVLGGIVLKTLYNKYSVKECNIVNAHSPEILEDGGPSYSTQETQLIGYCGNVGAVRELFQGNIASGSIPSARRSLSINSNIEVVNPQIDEEIDNFSFSSSLLGTENSWEVASFAISIP